MNDKRNYIEHKYFGKSFIMVDNLIPIRILSYLERLGFSMSFRGTYVYKDLILMVCDELKTFEEYGNGTCLELISSLKNSESNLYRRLALKLEISLDCLNLLLRDTISKINYDNIDEGFLNLVLNDSNEELDYGELAYMLASMILGYRKEKKNGKIKIRSL